MGELRREVINLIDIFGHLLLRYIANMFPFLLCILIGMAVCQYDTSWTIPLIRTPTAIRIVSSGRSNHQHILTGHSNG
jgi:hypothetical protein